MATNAPAVGLSGNNRDPRGHTFGKSVQKFGSAADNAFPFLPHAREVPGDVNEHNQRDPEGVTHPNKARSFFCAGGVEAAAQAQRVVRDHTDCASSQAAKTDNDIR